MTEITKIRNFAIIAHIDHGKSTLADRFLEITKSLEKANKQTLDSNPIEQERGITIKLAPVRMEYKQVSKSDSFEVSKSEENISNLETSKLSKAGNFETYILNLIDTPGHVDFSYEVSRALAACEGAILLVDASQGIQAQTLAHYRVAKKLGLKIIPAVNKIDLPSANIVNAQLQLMETFDFEESDISLISAKTGQGVAELLNRVVKEVPAPRSSNIDNLRALVFNSKYDPHQGVVAWIKVVEGQINHQDDLWLIGTKANTPAIKLGNFKLNQEQVKSISTGDVGWAVTGLKDSRKMKIGDTVCLRNQAKNIQPLPGYQPPKPMIFASFYPIDQSEYLNLGEALDKLKLLDSSLEYVPESSPMLGNGYRVGFLGLLHAEIVQERLSREFDLDVFASAPNVKYQIATKFQSFKDLNQKDSNNFESSKPGNLETKIIDIESPQDLPDPSQYEAILEPMLDLTAFAPQSYTGAVIQIFQEHRGELIEMHTAGDQVQFNYQFPLAELVGDFYSKIKSASSGYASLDYQLSGWQAADLVKLDILLAGDNVPALAQIVPRDQSQAIGRRTVGKLKEVIPRHNFEIAIQAAIGGKILARETIKPFRKDVTAKLYGGDQTRKDKLLKKQKKGKSKMKQMGKVSLPPDTFWKLLK